MKGFLLLARFVTLAVAAVALASLGLINWRAYQPGRVDTAIAQLRFLEGALDAGAAERMQSVFPEGYVFTWALYGLAWAQVAMALPSSDPLRDEALSAAGNAVSHVTSDHAKARFVAELSPPYGAFYSSWSLYLRSVLLRATRPGEPAPFALEEYERDGENFASALSRGSSPFLPSYPAAVWPADTVVGVAALAIRDSTLVPRYRSVIANWLAMVRQRLDPELGAISHAANHKDGMPWGGVRGESLALMSRLLVDVDASLARQEYAILRQHFVDYAWGVPGVREYPLGVDGRADIDSGPIVLGFSGPAAVVGAGAAIANGDDELADTLLTTAEVAGFPVELAGRRRYAGGFIPIGDAFLAWSRTTPSPLEQGRGDYGRLVPRAWRLPLHAASFVLAGSILHVAFRVWQGSRSKRQWG